MLKTNATGLGGARLGEHNVVSPFQGWQNWWAVTGSNRRHPACKAGALPAELTANRTGFYRPGALSRRKQKIPDNANAPAAWPARASASKRLGALLVDGFLEALACREPRALRGF